MASSNLAKPTLEALVHLSQEDQQQANDDDPTYDEHDNLLPIDQVTEEKHRHTNKEQHHTSHLVTIPATNRPQSNDDEKDCCSNRQCITNSIV